MSALATVEINAGSKDTIFAGNLLKAPPLSRRGRKKWHERYIILRANRTIETFKTRKAGLSHKSPRRVIDLRSCINLEIGLEYKNLQHVMSIGTFKRTFFFAAPSDPLMLQWAYLLEKVKNAQEGEIVEVLDIGLRKSRDRPAIHRVKQSSQRHSLGLPQYRAWGTLPRSKTAGISLANLSRSSNETVNLRASQESRKSLTESGQGNQTNFSESSCSDNGTPAHSPAHIARPVSYATVIPNHVPPPTSLLATAKRNKDGYFVTSPKRSPTDSALSTGNEEKTKETRKKTVEFVEKLGTLTRGRAIKAPGTGRKAHKKQLDKPYSTPNPSLSIGQTEALHLHSNMKRSFRYRKITLRPEHPLFEDHQSDSEDEVEDKTCSGSGDEGSISVVEISEEHVTIPGNAFAMSPMTKEMAFDPINYNANSAVIPRANTYSKVVIGSVEGRLRASSQPPAIISAVNVDNEEEPFTLDTLPARRPSDCYTSRSSLDDICVEPPAMFNSIDTELSSSEEVKSTKEVHKRIDHMIKGFSHMTACIIPSFPSGSHDHHVTLPDRHSTESNDTGYISGATCSPGVGEQSGSEAIDIGEFQLVFKDDAPGTEEDTKEPPRGQSTDQSADGARSYLPLLFYCVSSDQLKLQVCLVEAAEELIKDLVSLKAFEHFQPLECDEVHGNDNVSAVGDDFTVETSLEDLEFGFSITKSTQKDLFLRKVRESTFEIQNLFGTSKPFSCDVVIRHSEQMIVMPIEVAV